MDGPLVRHKPYHKDMEPELAASRVICSCVSLLCGAEDVLLMPSPAHGAIILHRRRRCRRFAILDGPSSQRHAICQ